MELEQTMNINLNEGKNNFLSSTLGKTVNNGIDLALRYLLPDLIEDEIIDLKNNLINFGLKEGIKKSIDSTIQTGKEAMGIISGNFENIGQIQKIIKNGGIIDKVSGVLDIAIDNGNKAGKINNNITYALKKGKNAILDSVERSLETTINSQISGVQLVDKYINNWKDYYNMQDFNGMQKEYKKIQEKLKELIPIENTLKNARYVENIHNLIKNNNQNFNLTAEELELAKNLNP